jgi:hypothetical protein
MVAASVPSWTAPIARLLRLAKTGTGQAFQAHREFVRAAEFEERPLRGATIRIQNALLHAAQTRSWLANLETLATARPAVQNDTCRAWSLALRSGTVAAARRSLQRTPERVKACRQEH